MFWTVKRQIDRWWRQARVALACALALMSLTALAEDSLPHELTACGDSDEFPPYTYFQRKNGVRTETATGYSVEFLQRLLADAGFQLKVSLIPWARCIALGARGEYDIVLDGTRTPIRERDFLFAGPHSSIGGLGVLFRIADQQALPASSAELAKRVLCGLVGYNYEVFGISASHLQNQAYSYEAAIKMLRAGRCELLVAGEQHLLAQKELNRKGISLGTDLQFHRFDWLPAQSLFLMVGREHPQRQKLLALLDAGVRRMQVSGETGRLTRKYLQ